MKCDLMKNGKCQCSTKCAKLIWYEQGRADKYQEITSEYMLLTEKQVADIRADAIDEFAEDMLNKIIFEEKWLFNCKSNNADTNIMISSLKTFIKSRAEQLKERK